MNRKKPNKRTVFLVVWIALMLLISAGILLMGLPPGEKTETIKEVMKDGVLHESNKVLFFGMDVNPAVISAYLVTALLLVIASAIRIFAVPKFKVEAPGKFQNAVETVVEFFSDLAFKNSPHKSTVVGAYIFSAGIYVFFSTVFELFGLQAVTTKGMSIALPAPLADINGAIGMGLTSYLFILGAGIVCNGVKGGLGVLKDFSLPISMSFRLFGALLSGLLVTELVYYYINLSFVLPVLVGILFTLMHAVIQMYVLITLVSIFYGEAVEPPKKDKKKKGRNKNEND